MCVFPDGSSGPGRVLSLNRRLPQRAQAPHQIARILRDQPTRPRHVPRRSFGILFVSCDIWHFPNLFQLLLEQRNYSHLPTYVFKADAALDATSNNSNNANATGSGTTGTSATGQTKKKSSTERQHVQSKLDLATALSQLAGSNYERAAHYFLKLGPAKDLGDWLGKVSRTFIFSFWITTATLDLVCDSQ